VDTLLKATPGVPPFLRLHAFILSRLSLELVEVGDIPGAHRSAVQALEEIERLGRADAGDRQARGDIATFRSGLGLTTFLSGRVQEADAVMKSAIAEFDDLEKTGAVAVDQRSQHGQAFRRAGDISRAAGRIDEAHARYLQALSKLDPVPRDLEYESELAVVLMRLGETAKTGAKSWHTRSLEVWRSAESRGVRAGRLTPGGTAQLEAMLR
jgi:tetratricopeptide (TPR) repeat protein